MRAVRLPLLASLFALTAGCGEGRPPVHAVDGLLVYKDGKPVPRASVTFTAEVGGKAYHAHGVTGADGKFKLTTFAPDDGAVAGDHAVAVGNIPGGDGPDGGPTVPDKYTDPEKTKLAATVGPPAATVRLEIDRPGKR